MSSNYPLSDASGSKDRKVQTNVKPEKAVKDDSASYSSDSAHWKGLWEEADASVAQNADFGTFSTGESLYDSFENANDARRAKIIQDDNGNGVMDSTLPLGSNQWQRWVVVFVHAMVDMTQCQESTAAKNKFKNIWAKEGQEASSKGRAQVEIMAWDILKHMQDYHRIGGPVDPATKPNTTRRRGEGAFEQHAHDVATALRENKTICHDVAKRRDIQLFVDDVERTVAKKISYRTNNADRAVKLARLKGKKEKEKLNPPWPSTMKNMVEKKGKGAAGRSEESDLTVTKKGKLPSTTEVNTSPGVPNHITADHHLSLDDSEKWETVDDEEELDYS